MSVIPYRIEISPNKRAGCQDGLCKEAKTKIDKGDVRFGTWVELPNFPGSYRWKHWGCVTPQQIAHWADKTDGNPNLIDGWEDLGEDLRDKVRRAMRQGHVDDEDWKHDPAENRIDGKKRARKSKKAKAEAEDEIADQTAEPDADAASSPQKPKQKKRTKAQQQQPDANADADVDAGEDDVAPPAKKKRAKKVKSENSNEIDLPAVSGKARSTKVKSEDADGSDIAPASKQKRSKKVKSEEDDQQPAPKGKKAKRSKVKQEEDNPAPANSSPPAFAAEGLDGAADSPPEVDQKALKGRKKRKSHAAAPEADGADTPAAPKDARRAKKVKLDDSTRDEPPAKSRGRKQKGDAADEVPLKAAHDNVEQATRSDSRKKTATRAVEAEASAPNSKRSRSKKST